MKIQLKNVLEVLRLAGINTPAFEALYGQVKVLFTESDQETLQGALADARLANDVGHAELQAKLDAAAKK